MGIVTDRFAGINPAVAFKAQVRCATTANITLSGFQTIDTVVLASTDANLRVLVKNQTDQTQNGIYDAKAGAWTRAIDFDSNTDAASGTQVYVQAGSQANQRWYVSTTTPIVLGTTNITWARVIDSTPLVNDLTTGGTGAALTAEQGKTLKALIDALNAAGYLPTSGGSMTGKLVTKQSVLANAGLNLPAGVAPSSPVNGDVWMTASALFARIAGATAQFLTTAGGTLIGKLITLASATGGAGFNMPHGAAPTSPVDGDVWTTTAGVFARINGATVGPFTAAVTGLTSGTTQASTSGTFVDFSSLPAGLKRITVMLSGVSTNGTSPLLLQLSTGGSLTANPYSTTASTVAQGSGQYILSSAVASGFYVTQSLQAASAVHGQIVLTNMGSNIWVMSTNLGNSGSSWTCNGGGSVSLGGALDRVRITTNNGTDAFDAGNINIMYE